MAITTKDAVLYEAIGMNEGSALRIKQALLVVAGIMALTIAAKAAVPMWPSPVPITLGTFAVLTIGAAYGWRLGLVTVLGYMAIGAAGYDVFASSSSETNGIAYLLGGTGGYLFGYVLAVGFLGWAARQGHDRSVLRMGLALLVANALIYVPGVVWLHQFTSGWAQTMDWGLTPYLIGDAMKLGLAALLVPGLWKLVGKARG